MQQYYPDRQTIACQFNLLTEKLNNRKLIRYSSGGYQFFRCQRLTITLGASLIAISTASRPPPLHAAENRAQTELPPDAHCLNT